MLIADPASTGLAVDSSALPDGLVRVVRILIWSVIIDALAYRFPRVATS